ncbi:hypothetical protein NQ315_008270 [Exocentrus adspersus]|uniref:Transposase Tc1-like domain-containing protein n=1 Tax=Exocentrus adspersus TaxID=1586481 RepID=A0AAV8VME5_9CUCU|nr:hypothetical protein NQ315_008270 [Exocentrus adspersus]
MASEPNEDMLRRLASADLFIFNRRALENPVNVENRRLIEAYGGAQLAPEPDEGIIADCPDEQGTRGFRMIRMRDSECFGCQSNTTFCGTLAFVVVQLRSPKCERSAGKKNRLQKPVRQGVGKVSNNEEDKALVEYIRQNPFQTAVKAQEEILFPGSVITARRRLKQSGLKNCAAVSKTFLSNDHKQRRIQFANAFLNRGHEFWNNVIFSDEKTFQSCNSGRLRVYRPRNTRFEERYTLPNASSGRFSVNVWGWISVEGPGVCWQIDGRLTGEN